MSDYRLSYKNKPKELTNYNVPPSTEYELKCLLIELALKNLITYPIDTLSLYRLIKRKFRNIECSVFVFNRLDINPIIKEMIDNGCFEIEEIIISLRKCYYIKKANIPNIEMYSNKVKGIKEYLSIANFDNYIIRSKHSMIDHLVSKTNNENFINKKNKNCYYLNSMLKDSITSYSNVDIFERSNIPESLLNYKDIKITNDENNTYKTNTKNLNEEDEDVINFMNDMIYGASAKMVLGSGNNNNGTKTNNIQNDEDNTDFNKANFNGNGSKNKLNSSNEFFIDNNNNNNLESKSNSNTLNYNNVNISHHPLPFSAASSLKPFCPFGTRAECLKKNKKIKASNKNNNNNNLCELVHFKQIIKPHTDISQGDCSYLETCRHMDICKYVHYEIEDSEAIPSNRKELILSSNDGSLPSQWINCDIRYFNLSILGNFEVIMADPPWDIHMDLPYGTLSDEEMKNIKVQNLQTDGVIFLWVTGRATELARECLDIWGYTRQEELVWIKTNQLQRLIRTGRTGHWLNHSKEHCLIGIKGNPKINRNLDCDVLVSEVRETSRKPDEIYELIERMSPGGRKIELFARPHNRRYGWVSLGNQLPGAFIVEDDVINRFNTSYPNEALNKEDMEMNRIKSIETKEG